MSFILDALKKSESDQQRRSGPALFEVKVAPPKARFPIWAIAIVALLVINMVIVGWLLLRHSSRSDEAAAPAASAVSAGNAGPGNGGSPAPSPPGAGYQANNPQPPPGANQTNNPQGNFAPQDNSAPLRYVPPQAPAAPSQGVPADNQSLPARGRFSAPPEPDTNQNEPTLAGNARDASGGNPRDAGGNAESGANPDDFTPAADPEAPLFKGHVKRGTESGLMLYQDVAVTQGSNLPQLRLDLHVYAAKPQDRFALINMHKVHEGDSLQGNVRVESITPDGVVMSHNGSKFLLPRE